MLFLTVFSFVRIVDLYRSLNFPRPLFVCHSLNYKLNYKRSKSLKIFTKKVFYLTRRCGRSYLTNVFYLLSFWLVGIYLQSRYHSLSNSSKCRSTYHLSSSVEKQCFVSRQQVVGCRFLSADKKWSLFAGGAAFISFPWVMLMCSWCWSNHWGIMVVKMNFWFFGNSALFDLSDRKGRGMIFSKGSRLDSNPGHCSKDSALLVVRTLPGELH